MGDIYLDYGPVLPEAYGRDVLEALTVSPEQVFVFWERTWEPPAGEDCLLVLREISSGMEQTIVAGRIGRHIFSARPGQRYRAHIGYQEKASFAVKQTSSEVATPVAGAGAMPSGSSLLTRVKT